MPTAPISVWENTAIVKFNQLLQPESTDVCVVGGGIAGLSLAYFLLEKGKSVVVLEAHSIGAGETGNTTAHLTYALDEGFLKLQKLFGVDGATMAGDSHRKAIDAIEHIVQVEGVDCDFRRVNGYLFSRDVGKLQTELEATHRCGLTEVSMKKKVPLSYYESGDCLCYPDQAQFHPLKYLNGLAQVIIKKGGKIFTNTYVTDVQEKDTVVVTTRDQILVSCKQAVIATNTPFINTFTIHTKQAAYRSYVLGLAIAKGSVPIALYWDTEEPYHYVRVMESDQQDILLVGGEDHKTGQANDADLRFQRLQSWAKERFPITGEVLFSWSGQVMEPIDGLAFIGLNPGSKNVYIVTGDSGHGLTHGTIAGMLISDLILGIANPWQKLYDPARKNIHAFGRFFKESCNVALQYGKRLGKSEAPSEEAIQPGSGAVMNQNGTKVAVFKDAQGEISRCSALCPHLGCVVAWNSQAQTWDCPCHGSRFEAKGKVITGPATKDLSKM